MTKESDEATQPSEEASAAAGMSEEEIDANLEDSFPASDPPAWTLGSDHQTETRKSHSEDTGDEQS